MAIDNNRFGLSGTLDCGCHYGPWFGVTPPSRCARHTAESREDFFRTQRPLYYDEFRAPKILPAPPLVVQTVEQILDKARAQIVERLAAARTAKDPAAIDAWTLAYDALNHTSVQIAQARQVEKSK